MPLLTVRDGARSIVRRVEAPVALDELCPSVPPVPYAGGWLLRPEGATIELVSPAGGVHSTIAPGAAVALGDVTLALAADGDSARRLPPAERLGEQTRARLAIDVRGRRVPLGTRTLTLGRSPRCDLRLDDPTVDEIHCRIVATRAGWEIHDDGSINGTRLGGVRVMRALLSPGVAVVLGRTRLLCVGVDDDGPSGVERRGPLVGASPGMEAVRQDIARYAPLRFPVLVRGETGSGKELVARMLHQQSSRARGPFVAINAATIAPELVESELFGHERGAFTGAAGRRRGVFEEADGGTLFLDELGELPLAQQAKLLRVLETSEVRRVGAEGTVRVNVRLVCATHRDLSQEASDGRFRPDLLYRLDVLRITLPPLRARRDDLPALARHLLSRITDDIAEPKTLDDAAVAALLEHDWPGNVRELYATLCRAAAASEGERIGIEHLSLGPSAARSLEPARTRHSGTFTIPPPPRLPRDLHGEALKTLVDQLGGNLSRAARVTGLARSTLRDRLRRSEPSRCSTG